MTEKEFKGLIRGDMLRSKSTGQIYVVTGHYGLRVTAVKSVDLTNPDEWELVEINND